jgi:sodium/potassium-transporting ATPase subunit alpha
MNTTEKRGMKAGKAKELHDQLGDNALTERKGSPWYVKLIAEMTQFFSLLLWAGAGLCFVAYALDRSD